MCIIFKLTILSCVLKYVTLVQNNCYGDITFTVEGSIKTVGFNFYLPFGTPLEMFCSGPGPLAILVKGARLPIEEINSTTVRYKEENPKKQVSAYICYNLDTKCALRLLVDGPPEINDFKCVSDNLDVLNCSWTENNVLIPNVSLSFMENNRKTIPCVVNGEINVKFCIWNTKNNPLYRQSEETLLFSMDACNIFGCTHNMYKFDHITIVKPDPPEHLNVINKTTSSVNLEWTVSTFVDFLGAGLEHKIEYWFYGIQFRQVNVTLPLKQPKYQLDLSLPCANQYYEVRISTRLIRGSKTGLWSEYASICFSTDAELKDNVNINPACDTVKENPDVMIYFVRKFRQSVNKELTKFKDEIRVLKERADSIHE